MEDQNPHSSSSELKKLGELIKGIKIAMLTTVSNRNSLHSSPLLTQEIDFDGTLWFLISKTSQKVGDIHNEPRVSLSYVASGKYISVSGTAELIDDQPDIIRKLWSKSYEAWFPQGPNDPHVQLLKIDVDKAEYWEGHSTPIAKILEFVKITTGTHHIKMGSHGELDLKH